MLRPYSTQEEDKVTKTQPITNDEVTNIKTITEKMSDLRGYIQMPRLCSTQVDEVTRDQSVATPPFRGVGEHQDQLGGVDEHRELKAIKLVKKVPPLSFIECEELGVTNSKRCSYEFYDCHDHHRQNLSLP